MDTAHSYEVSTEHTAKVIRASDSDALMGIRLLHLQTGFDRIKLPGAELNL